MNSPTPLPRKNAHARTQRFPIGSSQKFEDLLMERAEDGPKAVKVSERSKADG